MKKLLLFGGTSEEHELITALAPYPIEITLCVVSEYARAFLPEESQKLRIRVGRQDAKQMAEMMAAQRFSCVVDATHPYAAQATENIQAAAAQTGLPYLRLLREKSDPTGGIIVPSIPAAAKMLTKRNDKALITTGSKELAAFTQVPDYAERLYPRVLPTVEAIQACLALGFLANHIIAIQGPFSKELNVALLRQFDIQTLVTKDGGEFGGFPEKLAAAREFGATTIVIRRPDEAGFAPNKVVQRLLALLEGKQ